jgi:hypothetical protein
MILINAVRFLLTFIVIAILSFIWCLLFGVDNTLILLQKNGVILTNDKNLRNEKK